MIGTRNDTGEVTKLINEVHLRQDQTDMFCDSAYFNIGENNVEAFGNVHITQPGGTQVQSDYLRYIGDKKLAYLRGNVKLDDGKNSLYSEELTYNLGTKVAVYEQGGTLQADATTVSSNKGTYNVNTKQARFTEEVIVTDPQYTTTSEDLGYNTGTEVVDFYGPLPSTVINDKSTLITTSGTYDTKREVAKFSKRTSLRNKEQFAEGDKIDYNRNTGYGYATGNVIAIDTVQHSTMYSDFAAYNEQSRILISTRFPVLKQMNEKDSLFIAADTFYSAPEVFKAPKPKDTTVVRKPKVKRNRAVSDSVKAADMAIPAAESTADTSAPRYYIGYHNVRIFSDSLQGRCDSISYSGKDSVMRMMGNPIVWSRKSQITGDTILLFMENNKIKRLFIPSNAIIVSLAGPEKAELYDQVQGKTINAFFENNTINEMIVKPGAETITYQKDDSGAYIGVNQSESERMHVYFKNEQVQRIVFGQQVKQTMTPLTQADLPNMRLSRFKWLDNKRPKSLSELFDRETKKVATDTTGRKK